MTATFEVTLDRPICRPFEHVSRLAEGEPRRVCRVMASDESEAMAIAARRHPTAKPISAVVVKRGQPIAG